MNAVKDEQGFLLDWPLYRGIREQQAILLGSDQGRLLGDE